MALRMLPGLPAYLLFMMIRYTDYINNDDHAKSLIQRAIFYVKKAIKRKGTNDVEVSSEKRPFLTSAAYLTITSAKKYFSTSK